MIVPVPKTLRDSFMHICRDVPTTWYSEGATTNLTKMRRSRPAWHYLRWIITMITLEYNP